MRRRRSVWRSWSSPDYEFPKRMGKGDFVIIAVAVAVSLVLIALCMTGVIA